MTWKLRQGVVGVFVNERREVLLCERANHAGAWQFPQGGIDPGESIEQALVREMSEELGVSDFHVIKQGQQTSVYWFPAGLDLPITRDFDGQEHVWFELAFSPGVEPDLAKSDGEFRSYQWTKPQEVLGKIVDWKKQAYRVGLKTLNLIGE